MPATDPLFTDASVTEAINEALTAISLEHPWPWLETKATITGGTNPIDMSDDAVFTTGLVRDIKSVFIDGREVDRSSLDDIDLAGARDTAAAWSYAIWGDDLVTYPEHSASNSIVVRYYRNEPLLVDDTDEPLMPAPYHYAIVHKAASICFESLDDQSSAILHEARSRLMLDKMEANALRKRRGPHGVRVRSGSGI